ncbi:hypothetical protein D3C84_1268440 [compost metagenome]
MQVLILAFSASPTGLGSSACASSGASKASSSVERYLIFSPLVQSTRRLAAARGPTTYHQRHAAEMTCVSHRGQP